MTVIDELYGPIEFPDYLIPIITSPELQRLRDVRLINVFSTSLASLSDVRRITHTLGVAGLFLRLKPRFLRAAKMDSQLCKTIEIACLAHDVATPAFAHLFEYELKKKTGWNHEDQLESIIKGTYRPEGKYHQIYFGNQLSLNARILELGVDPEQVCRTIRGKAPYSQLISGTIDLDNIDNVFRMYNALGIKKCQNVVYEIVDLMIPNQEDLIFRKKALPAIQFWSEARRSCYNLLLFDEQTLSSQAMLGELLWQAVETGFLNEEYWHLTDDQLLYKLFEGYKPGREILKRLAIGNHFAPLGIYWYEFEQEIADALSTHVSRERLASELRTNLKVPCYLYYFEDRGTFEKNLNIKIGNSDQDNKTVNLGKQSHSMIVAIFTSSNNTQAIESAKRSITKFFESMLPSIPSVRRLPSVRAYYEINRQEEFPI